MRRITSFGGGLFAVALLASVAAPELASGQVRSPGGTTPGGAIFDRLNESTTRPVPQTPSPTVPSPGQTWVPDRYVQVPGVDNQVLVPGHWERGLSDHEVYVPPLVGRTTGGNIINFPAGVRPPVNERQAP